MIFWFWLQIIAPNPDKNIIYNKAQWPGQIKDIKWHFITSHFLYHSQTRSVPKTYTPYLYKTL